MSNKVNAFQVGGDTYGIIPDLTFDNYPTIGSSNPVTSNGIAEAIQGAAVGTDISVGREPGTPIGYCSIAYGTDNVASSDYSIVFGKYNRCISDTTIVSGINCETYFGYGNIIEGNNSIGTGYGNIVSGIQCFLGSEIKDITSGSYDMFLPETYVGYLNLSNKKLYYDAEMTVEQTIEFSPTYNYGTTYIVDMTNDTGRTPGTIYEYEKKRSGRVDVVTISLVLNRYAWFMDYCRNSLYFYKGACYYDTANDKNYSEYSGGSFSGEITSALVGEIYFDLLSGEFLLYCKTAGVHPYQSAHPDWLKVKVYRYPISSALSSANTYTARFTYNRYRYGRFAYVYTDRNADASKYGRVYSTSDYSETSDITNQLLDGEYVIDLSKHETSSNYQAYKYRFNSNHVLSYVCATGSNSGEDCGWDFGLGNGCAVLGSYNHLTGGKAFGSMVAGTGNSVNCGNSGMAMFGINNSASIGRTDGKGRYGQPSGGDQACFSIVGVGNSINTTSTYCHSGYLFGESNSIQCTGGVDHLFVAGYMNTLKGENMGTGSYITGSSNRVNTANDSHVTGRNNQLYFEGESIVDGSFNNIGYFSNRIYNSSSSTWSVTNYSFVDIHINKSGIYEGQGVTYDAVNQTYTFDTNKIYKVYGIPENMDRYADNTSDVLIRIAYSSDGHTLNDLNVNSASNVQEYNAVYVRGVSNSYIRSLENGTGLNYSNQHNIIIGSNNIMYAYGTVGITMIGRGLMYYKGPSGYNPTAPAGAMYVGSYNALCQYYDGGGNGEAADTSAMFVVGIGSGPEDRRNGFVITKDGTAGLPCAPDTISEATRLCSWNPNRMLITYGMLRDYAPKTPGAVGKPAVTTVTLAANGWTGSTQTVQVTGVTAGAVVIAQPSGDPYTYNFNSIYLSAQADDELTFTCATLPSVDVSVKVVYWT